MKLFALATLLCASISFHSSSSSAGDYIFLDTVHDEDATEHGISYVLIPMKSLHPKTGFAFKRWTDATGREIKKAQMQYILKKDENGNSVLRIFEDDSKLEAELGYLVSASNEEQGDLLVFHGKRRVGKQGKYEPYNLCLRASSPDAGLQTFLTTFLAVVGPKDDQAYEEILKRWSE